MSEIIETRFEVTVTHGGAEMIASLPMHKRISMLVFRGGHGNKIMMGREPDGDGDDNDGPMVTYARS